MASDGPGKYRERKSRTTKPYDRPKGIIRRVTDSVTGLFSTSWLSGWIGSEEDEESNDQQTGPPQTSTLAPAGESFIFAQPITARRPFRPIYPEEGETETNNQQSLGINEGASTSTGVRVSVPAAPSIGISATASRSAQLSGDTPRPSMSGRRLPIISFTPSPMLSVRTKSQLEPRSLPLMTASTPAGDDGSEVSESSVDTGVEASVIPRPDERDYQREILQLDEESLQTLRDSLTKSVPSAPAAQPASTLPSLEETRKRPRDLEPDNTSVRAEGSVSSKSLFSEVGDIGHGQPQPSGVGSKRPRFNVSLYGSPIMSDRSVLSDSAFKSSPFYPGKTMYGGASACRSRRLQPRNLHQTPRTQVRAKAAPESTDDGGLSQAARRILESLEQMSTPISDAKRIPTPTPGQRGSFLDATPSYTAAFHRHRPTLRSSAPPVSKLLTPTKLTIQENLATSLLASTSTSTSYPSGSPAPKKSTKLEEVTNPTEEVAVSEQEETKKPAEVSTESSVASPFSKAAAEATAKLKPSKAVVSSATTAALSSDEVKFVIPTNSSASPNTFEFTPKPATTVSSFTSESSQPSKKVGGKMKSKVVDSGRSSARQDENEVIEEPQLPSVPLTMFSLPKIDLSIPSPVTSSPSNFTSSSKGFKFSVPKIVDTQSDSETLPSAPKFTFRSPVLINEGNIFSDSSCTTVAPTSLMFNSSTPSSAPKLKTSTKKVVPTAEKLKEGSILDILKPKGDISDKLQTTTSLSNSLGEKLETCDAPNSKTLFTFGSKTVSEQSVNSVVEESETSHEVSGFGSAFKKSSDEWECSQCMVRNKNSSVKCVACESQKPEQISNSSTNESTSCFGNVEEKPPPLTGNVIGWGDAFKRSSDEWECDTCMLRNKDSVEKCVACETPKPGNRIVSAVMQEVSKVIDIKEEKADVGFGSAFTKGKGEWECDTCLVRNKSDATKCISCETPRPGAANVSQAITGNFKFGANTNDLSSTNSTFKFGISNSQSELKSSSFKFGVSAKSAEDSNSQGNSGFKFGVPTEKPNALTGFSFSSNSENVESKEKKTSASVGFSFGVQSSNSKEKEIIEQPSEVLHTEAEVADVSKSEINEPSSELVSTSKSNENSSENVTVPNPVFQFDSGNKTEVTFSFGSGTQVKSTVKEDQGKDLANENSSAVELKSENDLDALEKENPKPSDIFSSGNKLDDNVDSVEKPFFTFNNVLTAACKDNDKNANPLSFGASKVTDSTSESSSTLIFGASTGENATPAAGTFTFSDKESKTSVAAPFSFNPPSVSKESKSASIFNFSTKRGSSDADEPAKKMTFSSPSVGGINNGVSASSSLFTFGSKESKLNAGSGFREIPSSTLAFGARAPASSATPSFQFGNSNPPAPAATAPATAFGNPATAFGSAAPAFGSNNSSSTQNFVFGQPPEKTSAGFDFGQAANNTGTQGFNFAAAQSNSRIFLFGQGSANSTSQVEIFKFGTANTEVPTPASSIGPDNPFNSPAPPSRRVMKKAVRRNPRKQ